MYTVKLARAIYVLQDFYNNGGTSSGPLAFVTDHQGSVQAALRPDGTQELNASCWSRTAFGALEGASGTGSSINTTEGLVSGLVCRTSVLPERTGGKTPAPFVRPCVSGSRSWMCRPISGRGR